MIRYEAMYLFFFFLFSFLFQITGEGVYGVLGFWNGGKKMSDVSELSLLCCHFCRLYLCIVVSDVQVSYCFSGMKIPSQSAFFG